MAGANNKQMKAAGMSAKAVEHVRSTHGVVSNLASAAKAAKRAGKPVSGEAGKKLARPAPKVTWGEKVAASRKKAAEAFSVGNLMKRSAEDNGRKGGDSFSVANLMKRSEGAQPSSKLPTHISGVSKGSVRENRLHWAATKAKETGKQAYVVADTSRHAARNGGVKLTYEQPKRGQYMTVSPSGSISYHGSGSATSSRLPPLRERNRNMYIDESTRSKPGKLPPLRAAK